EAHAVDERPVVDEPEEPRPVVARLRARRDRADLDVAEAERAEARDHRRVLVEARRDAEGRRALAAERARREPRIRPHSWPGGADRADRGGAEVVRALRVDVREAVPEEQLVGAHRSSSAPSAAAAPARSSRSARMADSKSSS